MADSHRRMAETQSNGDSAQLENRYEGESGNRVTQKMVEDDLNNIILICIVIRG